MDLDNVMGTRVGGTYVDVRFFTYANLVSGTVENLTLHVCVEGEVVESAIGESVTIVFCIFGFGNQIGFGECRDGFVD